MAELSYAQVSALLKYDSDTGKLFWLPRPVEMCASEAEAKRWNTVFAGKEAFITVDSYGYKIGSIYRAGYKAHRIAWLLHYGTWPQNQVDHINGDPADNRIINLRDVTSIGNARNRCLSKRNKTGVVGVSWCKEKQKWQAYVSGSKGQKRLGYFDEFEDAAAARKKAADDIGFTPRHGRSR